MQELLDRSLLPEEPRAPFQASTGDAAPWPVCDDELGGLALASAGETTPCCELGPALAGEELPTRPPRLDLPSPAREASASSWAGDEPSVASEYRGAFWYFRKKHDRVNAVN